MFRSLISSLFSAVYFAVDRLRGRRQFKEMGVCKEGMNTLIVTAAKDFRMTVLVTKEAYGEHYTRSLRLANRHYLYTVRAEVSHDAPESLRLAVSKEVSFPPLLPSFVGEEAQVRRIVQSYMDIIRDRVERHLDGA